MWVGVHVCSGNSACVVSIESVFTPSLSVGQVSVLSPYRSV